MKFFLVTTMFLSMGLYAQAPGAGTQGSGYAPNDGKTSPGTFTSKSGMGDVAPSSSKTTTGVSAKGPETMGTSEYPNSGMTKNSENASAAPVTTESGITNSSGITTDQMNTSPNAAPTTDAEAQEDATLSSGEVYETGPYTREGTFDPQKPDEIEAQEENALDYSTTPKKRTTTPLGPNKK